jgi:dCTP deaminase
MIRPFAAGRLRKRAISYGLSAYGYDIRLADQFQLFDSGGRSPLDPKNVSDDSFINRRGKSILLPPNSFALGRSVEYFRIPRNVLTLCFGKSTYARCGVVINVTPFEPEWEGYATISISNTSPRAVKLYAGEGIAQVIFLESDEACRVSYADKKGKYQSQTRITRAKV